MSKKFTAYKKQRVRISIMAFAFNKKVATDDETVPFLVKQDLYKDTRYPVTTH
jgi:hypothetical protein